MLDERGTSVTTPSTPWTRLRAIIRWLLRRPESTPPPGTGERIQAAEREAARQRILELADRTRHDAPTQIIGAALTLGQRTGYDTTRSTRGEW